MTTIADPAVTDYVRDQWGRPLIVPVGGGKPVPYTRSSSAAKTVEDHWNLEMWARRNICFGFAHDQSLVARTLAISGTPYTWSDDQKKQVNKIHEDAAAVALAHKGADIGTALHTMTQRVDLGEAFDAGIYTDDLDAYGGALTEAGFETRPEWVECRLVCDELEMAGTADRILVGPDGRHLIADIKTGTNVAYGGLGWAAQLACYAHGKLYDVASGERLETPAMDVTTGIIIHLPAGTGTCTLYEIDLVAGYRAAQLANEIRAVRQASRRWIQPLSTAPPQAAVEPLEPRNVIPLHDIPDRRARLLERYHGLHPARRARFVAMKIDPADLDAVEAALDELTQPRRVDNERLADVAADLSLRMMTITVDDRATLDAISKQAHDGPGPISFRYEPFERNVALCRALVGMCEKGWNETTLRTLVACVLDDELVEVPTTSLAEWLALMSTDEAEALERLVAALGD